MSGCHNLKAFTPDGTIKWTLQFESSERPGQPIIDTHGTIYVPVNSPDNKLATFYAINPDGTSKWSYTIELATYTSLKSPPAISSDGTLYVSLYDGEGLKLYAFQAQVPKITSFTANPTTADEVPCSVKFTCEVDHPERVKEYQWDFNGDGQPDEPERKVKPYEVEYEYKQPGVYKAKVTIIDKTGSIADSKTRVIRVGDLLAKYAPILKFTDISDLEVENLTFSPRELYFPTAVDNVIGTSTIYGYVIHYSETGGETTPIWEDITGVTPEKLNSEYIEEEKISITKAYFDLDENMLSEYVKSQADWYPENCVIYGRRYPKQGTTDD